MHPKSNLQLILDALRSFAASAYRNGVDYYTEGRTCWLCHDLADLPRPHAPGF